MVRPARQLTLSPQSSRHRRFVVSSTAASIYPDADFAWFPLRTPGIASLPAGFFLGRLGTVRDKGRPEESGTQEKLGLRMLVGADD